MIIIDRQTNKVQVRGTVPEITAELTVAIITIYNMTKDKDHNTITFLEMLFSGLFNPASPLPEDLKDDARKALAGAVEIMEKRSMAEA